jgi:hypothetical protein
MKHLQPSFPYTKYLVTLNEAYTCHYLQSISASSKERHKYPIMRSSSSQHIRVLFPPLLCTLSRRLRITMPGEEAVIQNAAF